MLIIGQKIKIRVTEPDGKRRALGCIRRTVHLVNGRYGIWYKGLLYDEHELKYDADFKRYDIQEKQMNYEHKDFLAICGTGQHKYLAECIRLDWWRWKGREGKFEQIKEEVLYLFPRNILDTYEVDDNCEWLK